MKKIILLLLITFSVFSQEVTVETPGIVCQMCVYGLKKHFKSVVDNPDKDIIVDLDKKFVKVNLKTKISEDDIKKRVKDAGYEAGKITWSKVDKASGKK